MWLLHSQFFVSFKLLTLVSKIFVIATTQYSPELNNLDWGGSIITKIDHHTTPHQATPCDYFFDQNRQVWSNVVQFRVEQ